jgi:two-component system response regulator MtrA
MDERVLVVEDDASIREVVALGLTRSGFKVTSTGDGRDGLMRALNDPFDAVLLDVMLPSLDGFEVCRELRKTSRIPVIMLTARTDTTDVVVGLELGADDYVTKPFEISELVARLRAVLRRSASEPQEPVVQIADIEIDPTGYVARRAGRELELTATEFRLLLELARNAGRALSREVLLSKVWNYDYLGDSRLVDVAVQRLRGKIERDPANPVLIRTVRGVGYRMDRVDPEHGSDPDPPGED